MNKVDQLQVVTDPYASDQELQAIEDAFRDSGMAPTVKKRPPPASILGPISEPWIVQIFVSGFFGAAGTATWTHLGQLVRRLVEARETSSSPAGTIIVSDANGGELLIEVPMDRRYPADAWDELEALREGSALRDRRLNWDFDDRRWRSENWTPPVGLLRRFLRWLFRR